MSTNIYFRFIIFSICLFTYGNTNAALVVDLWQNFSDSQSYNTNGFITYGYAPTTNTYRSLSDCGTYYFCRPEESRWKNPQVFRSDAVNGWLGEPWVGLIPSGTASNTQYPEDAVLAWVVPKTAYYQINGSYYLYPDSANGVDVYIKKNTNILYSYHLSPGGTNDFNMTTLLFNEGDTIYFGADAHNDVDFSEYNDWPFVKGKIQEVAEAPTQYLDVITIPDVTGDGIMDQAVLTLKLDKYYLLTINGLNGKQLKQVTLGATKDITPKALAAWHNNISVLIMKSTGITVLELHNRVTLALTRTMTLAK